MNGIHAFSSQPLLTPESGKSRIPAEEYPQERVPTAAAGAVPLLPYMTAQSVLPVYSTYMKKCGIYNSLLAIYPVIIHIPSLISSLK